MSRVTTDHPGLGEGDTGGPAGRRLRGLLVRLLTAAVLIPLAVGMVVAGGRVYSATIAFMVIILIFEWTRIVDKAELSRGFYTLSATAILTVFFAAGANYSVALFVALGGGLIATLVELRSRPPISWAIVGAVYLIVPAIAALYIRHSAPDGQSLTLLLFAVVWATDSGAYLVGTFVGGPKLWPSLSPRKTWSGAVGGIAFGTIVAAIGAQLLGLPYGWELATLVGAVLAVAAIAGDLLESAIKRVYGVKDTGGAFPGHGGVLDRLDGFIVAVTILALLLVIADGIGT